MFKKYITFFIIFIKIIAINFTLNAQNLSFSGGNAHSIMLCQNGNVYTMGNNANGQLGTGAAPTSSIIPIQVLKGAQPTTFNDGTNLGSIKQVDAGSGATNIALSCNGTVYSWGWNDEGQVGDNTVVNRFLPVQVVTGLQGDASGFLSNVVQVSGGNKNGYAILSNGLLMAWGRNDEGQLGNGNNTDSPTPVYVKVNGATNLQNVTQIDGGDSFGVALLSNGTVWAWGYNNNRQLGQNDNTNRNFATQVFLDAARTTPLTNIIKITAGDTHVMALASDGTLYVWGGNWSGQLAYPSGADVGLPVKARLAAAGADLSGVATISAGNQHSIVSLTNGTVMTWGGTSNYQGQTGTGSSTSYPVVVPSLSNIIDVSDGDLWSFAVNSSGTVYSFGQNNSGQLGVNTSNATEPTPLTITLPCAITKPCPKPNLGADVVLCQPSDVTLNAGTIVTGNIYTWKKNGVVIAGATTSSLYVNTSGIYRVIVSNPTIINGCGTCLPDSDDVNISSIATTSPTNPTYCSLPTTLNFCVTGSAGTNYDWYSTVTGGSPLNGSPSNCYSALVTTVPAIYYAQDRSSVNYNVGYTQPVASTLSGYGTEWSLNDPNKMYFDALSSFTLNSVQIDYSANPPSCGVANAYTISITGSSNFSIPVTLPCVGGLTTIPINVVIPVGTNYLMSWSGLGTNNMKHSTGGANWTGVEQSGIIDLKGPQSYQPNSSSSFFNWSLTSGSPCARTAVQAVYDCSLPVKYVEFSGYKKSNFNYLYWITNNETNNLYFIVQKSSDGINFKSIGKVLAKNDAINYYEFYDKELSESTVYYRLVQIDNDGKSSLSKVITLTNEEFNIVYFPNPSTNDFNFIVYGNDFNNVKIIVYTLDGKVILENTYLHNTFSFGKNFDAGMYFVKVYYNNNSSKIFTIVKTQ